MKVYNQNEFDSLSNKDKIVLSSICGKFLDNRIEDQYRIKLYQMNGYYIELWRCKKEDEILHVRTFIDDKNLDPYLDKIELPNP